MAGNAVPITLGGKQRWARFDLNALAVLENRLATPLGKFTDLPISARTTRTLAWAALLHEDASLTEEQVGAWVDGSNFLEVSEVIVRAFAEAFGGSNGKADGGENPTNLLTGSGSSAPAMPS